MHKSNIKGQTQSYVSVLRPEKRSILADNQNESGDSEPSSKELSQSNKHKTTMRANVCIFLFRVRGDNLPGKR